MGSTWPDFRLVAKSGCTALWEGSLTPLNREYFIQILYSLVSFPFAYIKKYSPNIEVISPLLQRRSDNPNESIPHIFSNKMRPERPILCLNEYNEWTEQDPVSICIPWTSEWLACYEGWRATGEWKGGGHGTERQQHRRKQLKK